MRAAQLTTLPDAWLAPLVACLRDSDPAIIRPSVAVLRGTPPAKEAAGRVDDALLELARRPAAPADVRLDALSAVALGDAPIPEDVFALLRASLEPGQAAGIRMAAAGVIEKARLSDEQLLPLAATIEHSAPLELPRLLAPFERGRGDEVGMALLAALERAGARGSLRPDMLRPRLAGYSPRVRERGEALLAAVAEHTAQQGRELDKLLAWVRDGDPRRGQSLFNSSKAACSTCHAIGYHGGKIGPDLTSIGQVRDERDLLEAIVFPSASFPRGYEPVVVTTTSGVVHNGVLRDDQADALVVTTAASEEIRIRKSSVADVQPGTISLMPSGYGQQLTPHELGDLVAFLKRTRWGAE